MDHRGSSASLPVTSELMHRGASPTAIFAGNDTVVIGVLAALKEHGVRVQVNDFGRLAGEMLITLVNGERPEPRHVILPTELIVRESISGAASHVR